jgi:hypothetical protein
MKRRIALDSFFSALCASAVMIFTTGVALATQAGGGANYQYFVGFFCALTVASAIMSIRWGLRFLRVYRSICKESL